MSHLRPEDIALAHKKSSCKRGRHRYGEAQSIEGGISRQVCVTCGAVTIDLAGATDDLATPTTGDRQPPASLSGSDR